jgi:Skp family chaperone for outer membrane proteins
MKNVLFIFWLSTLFTVQSVSAQEKPATTPAPVPVVQDPLQLTKEQQTPYREIIKRYATLLGELRRSVLTPEEKKQKKIILASQREAEIKSMLSPEQFEIFQKQEADRQARQVNLRKPPVKIQ